MSKIKTTLNIGPRIKQARKDVGLSQKQLAATISVSDKAISSYEVGRATPPVDILREISAVTYKPVQYFLGEEFEEIDVELKIKKIEQELLELKKLLTHKKQQNHQK